MKCIRPAFTLLLTPLVAATAQAGTNQWTGSGPFATGLGNRIIHALATDGNTVYAGTGSGTVFALTPPVPVATTQAATNVQSTIATLNGTVNANSADAVVSFEYGLTTDYGSTVTATPSVVSGSVDTAISADLSGLGCHTTYHYRAKAVSGAGTGLSGDGSFTTALCTQTIVFGSVPTTLAVGTMAGVSATASSGLAVTYSSLTPATCTVTGGTVTAVTVGTCTLTADQAGGGGYAPAVQQRRDVAIVPPGPPEAPTLVRLVPGKNSLKVIFDAPASDGGSSLTGYTVTCTPTAGGATAPPVTGSASPITVTGLTYQASYRCSVHANNGIGSSGESSGVVKVVRPSSIAALLGILLE